MVLKMKSHNVVYRLFGPRPVEGVSSHRIARIEIPPDDFVPNYDGNFEMPPPHEMTRAPSVQALEDLPGVPESPPHRPTEVPVVPQSTFQSLRAGSSRKRRGRRLQDTHEKEQVSAAGYGSFTEESAGVDDVRRPDITEWSTNVLRASYRSRKHTVAPPDGIDAETTLSSLPMKLQAPPPPSPTSASKLNRVDKWRLPIRLDDAEERMRSTPSDRDDASRSESFKSTFSVCLYFQQGIDRKLNK